MPHSPYSTPDAEPTTFQNLFAGPLKHARFLERCHAVSSGVILFLSCIVALFDRQAQPLRLIDRFLLLDCLVALRVGF